MNEGTNNCRQNRKDASTTFKISATRQHIKQNQYCRLVIQAIRKQC